MESTGVFYKEWATADFKVRQMIQSIYDPERMKWEIMPGRGNTEIYTYTSLYSWQTPDPLSTPIIHYVMFDFDSKMVDMAQEDAVNFVQYLEAMHEVNPGCLGMYFSGHKGFHIALPIGVVTNGEALWGVSVGVIRDFALRLGAGFHTMDTSVFDARRIFRINGGINLHSGLRKIALRWDELRSLDTDAIRAMAAESRDYVPILDEPAESSSLYELMLSIVETQSETNMHRSTASLQEIFESAAPGERNTKATQLTGLLVKSIDDLPLVREIVRCWNRSNQFPLTDRELEYVIKGVYERYHKRHFNQRRKHVIGF